MSYFASEFFESKYTSLSSDFVAPKKTRTFYSDALSPEQWKVEVRYMAVKRLALLQFYVLGIAHGWGHDLPHARNLLLDYGVDTKGKILFQGKGCKNVSLAGVVLLLVLCFWIWLVTFEVGEEIEGVPRDVLGLKVTREIIIPVFRTVIKVLIQNYLKVIGKIKKIDYKKAHPGIDIKLQWLRNRANIRKRANR